MTIRKDFERAGEAVRVTCESTGGEGYTVRVDDAVYEVTAHRTPCGRVSFTIDGRPMFAAVAPAGSKGEMHVRLDGRTWRVKPHLGVRGGAAGAGSGRLEAPMTGTVLAVHVGLGDVVTQGQTVAVVTAMKMEHKIVADVDGEVVEVGAAAGETIEQGHLLVRIEPAEQEG